MKLSKYLSTSLSLLENLTPQNSSRLKSKNWKIFSKRRSKNAKLCKWGPSKSHNSRTTKIFSNCTSNCRRSCRKERNKSRSIGLFLLNTIKTSKKWGIPKRKKNFLWNRSNNLKKQLRTINSNNVRNSSKMNVLIARSIFQSWKEFEASWRKRACYWTRL